MYTINLEGRGFNPQSPLFPCMVLRSSRVGISVQVYHSGRFSIEFSTH